MRTRDYVAGLPNLSAKDHDKVKVGNLLLQRTLQVVRLCERLGIPVSVENPRSSWLWRMPAMRRALARATQHHTVFVHSGHRG